jgi:hypothetical protein
MGYNVHNVLKKVVAYYKKKYLKNLNQFFVMIWNTKFTRNQHTFKNSYLFKKLFLKNHVMYLENYKHLL